MKKFCFILLPIMILLFSNVGIVLADGSAPGLNPLDALQKIDNRVASLSSSAFINPQAAEGQKKALLNKLKVVTPMVEYGVYCGAAQSLTHLRDTMQQWLITAEQSALFADIDNAIAAVDNASQTTITTAYGRVAGVADLYNVDCWVWYGIPFAKPPVGALRWKAPQDPARWNKVRHSNNNYSPCIQPADTILWTPTGKIKGSEDCLYLNIFRPRKSTAKLPVYFFIHGGGNTIGETNFLWASQLALTNNMIVVVIQYRLGPFGWLIHPALNPEGTAAEKSGNFGTLDQIKALQWVKKNIAAFGGDPDNVTIAGQSAGGSNVLNLMISPLAKGLFHKAVVESAGVVNIPVAEGINRANTLIDLLLTNDGICADLSEAAAHRASMSHTQIEAYLKGKKADEIIDVLYNVAGLRRSTHPFIDGVVLTGTAASVFESGNYNKVPVILGSNQYEMKPFMPYDLGSTPTSSGYTWANVYNVLGLAEPKLTLDELMPPDGPDRALYEEVGKYSSLTWKEAGVDSPARGLKKHQNNVYCYFYQWGSIGSGAPPYDFLIGAGHSFELPFIFGWPNDPWNTALGNQTNLGVRYALYLAINSYLGTFVATGNPNRTNNGLPIWEEWSNAAGGPKSIIWNSDYTQPRLSMMNEEVIKEDLMAQIKTLPPAEQEMIMKLAWQWNPAGIK